MLESLEQEYRREEDWCGGGERQPELLLPLVSKHMEQKEAFLKVIGGVWGTLLAKRSIIVNPTVTWLEISD